MERNGIENEHLIASTVTMSFQPIYDIAEICARKEIRNVVLCPGSRCAPLTLAFTRNEKLNCKTFSDERSAAFIALGMAQQEKRPVVLVCTSGTAAYNFAPAIAEAYFQQIPLIVFTADRPVEWAGQQDGQTIYQQGLYQNHVKESYQLPQHYDHVDDQWMINRVVNEAVNLASAFPQGPVHINVPFREPFYPTPEKEIVFSEQVRILEEFPGSYELDGEVKKELEKDWQGFNKVLVVSGQAHHSISLSRILSTTSNQLSIPIIGEIISNLHTLEDRIGHADTFLGAATKEIKDELKPDLLITFEKSIISRHLKNYIRNNKPKAHWHIQPAGNVADVFQSITRIIRANPENVFSFINTLTRKTDFEKQKQINYKQLWNAEERKTIRATNEFFPHQHFGEFELVHEVINGLPQQANLHLASSMSVRYANFIGLTPEKNSVKVFSNRGTSGIDGATSTAVGHALLSDQLNFLITGDVAFFYDRNAFWHNYPLPNLRILLLNNHGGAIFKMIDGPASLPETDPYFVTDQKLNAKYLCQEFDFDHLLLDTNRKIKNLLADFFTVDGRTKILEFESDADTCKTIVDKYKKKIKQHYEP